MSTRIKEDDPELEKSFALADVMQAARQPIHQGMRLGQIIDALQITDPEQGVQFDFGGFEPADIGSYRGYYSDLALTFSDRVEMTAGKLLNILQQADGHVFSGYKGGDYRMDRDTPVWVANYGECHGVAVVGVEDQGWRVLIRTAAIE